MSELKQKSIEAFFKKYGVTDPDKKTHLLQEVTDVVYDYNMLIVKAEKEGDEYKKKQILRDLKETEDKIDDIFKDASKK